MSDTDRVLRLLRQRGSRGIDQTDFLLPDIVDGGKPIHRLAPRVYDLRKQGHMVSEIGRRNRCSVYVLEQDSDGVMYPADPQLADDINAIGEAAATRLFEPDAVQPSNAILGDIA